MGTFAWHVFALPFTTCFHTHVFFTTKREKEKEPRDTRSPYQGELLFRVAICEYSRSRLQVAAVFVKRQYSSIRSVGHPSALGG